MRKALVIAGNFQEYKDFIRDREYNPKEYNYISDDIIWRGFHNIPIIKVGTWYRRKDINIKLIEEFVNPIIK